MIIEEDYLTTDEHVYQDTSVEFEEKDSYKATRQKRKGRNKKNKIYFTKETEENIIKYNEETCPEIRNQIYEEGIRYSFEKLVENIYNTFKFCYFDSSAQQVQQQTVCYLVTNIHKFKKEKGKAFSYFSIVAKHYLIFHNNNNYKHFNKHVNITEVQSENSDVCLQQEDPYYEEVNNKDFISQLITYWESNVNELFKKEMDLKIANSVVELFRNCDRLESFNKKMLYLYIKEMCNCKNHQITKVLNKMKKYQKKSLNTYFDTGFFGE